MLFHYVIATPNPKRRGRAKIKAGVLVELTDGIPAKLVFVRDNRKTDWLALLSTDVSLDDEQVVQIYGKRWDIEMFFKMAEGIMSFGQKSIDIGNTELDFMPANPYMKSVIRLLRTTFEQPIPL